MLRILRFILLFFPFVAVGQYHITGRVVDSASKNPVANVSVFLNNASAGTKTKEDGTYDIANVHTGYYDLVVSIVGFKTYTQSIAVNNSLSLPDIQLATKSIALREVTIGPDEDWDRKYALFKRDFLGTTDNARDCKILNPEVISLQFSFAKNMLIASSYDFIIIENKALGYRVKYLLSDFNRVYSSTQFNKLYYEGSAVFEDLKGSKRQIERWQKARLKTYLRSDAHFLRAVISNRVDEEGFVVRRLIRDTTERIISKRHDALYTTPLFTNEYALRTDQPGQYALAFKDCLFIKSTGKASFSMEATLSFPEPYTYFDTNGVVINPKSVILEGTWGDNRIADLLPVDYEPPVK